MYCSNHFPNKTLFNYIPFTAAIVSPVQKLPLVHSSHPLSQTKHIKALHSYKNLCYIKHMLKHYSTSPAVAHAVIPCVWSLIFSLVFYICHKSAMKKKNSHLSAMGKVYTRTEIMSLCPEPLSQLYHCRQIGSKPDPKTSNHKENTSTCLAFSLNLQFFTCSNKTLYTTWCVKGRFVDTFSQKAVLTAVPTTRLVLSHHF